MTTQDDNKMKQAPFIVSNRFLRLIAHDIFGDSPAVVMRELVQNASDAVLMRAAEQEHTTDWGIQISIGDQNCIEIVDSGRGMNADDIIESLTRLGMGKHDINELAKRVKNPAMLKNVAGYFGFGFVSAMIVSRKVEIWTHRDGFTPVYCKFDEGEDSGLYEEDAGIDQPVGTRLRLHIDADKARVEDDAILGTKGGTLLNLETMTKIVQRYCDLLEFDVTVSSGGVREIVNIKQAPWESERKAARRDLLSFFRRRFGERTNEPLDYFLFKFTRETNEIEASGVLYVPQPSSAGQSEDGPLEVFIKRIWVCDNDLELLPEWARFMRGVILSPDLMPALDRNGLDRLHKGYHALRIALRDSLRKYLVELATGQQETFGALLDAHGGRFSHGLLAERARIEGARPVWFTDLVRTVRFQVYSNRHPNGYRASANDILDIGPSEPVTLKDDGKKHKLHGINRVVPIGQQNEFRKVIADKSYPIIVPEEEVELVLLGTLGAEFEDVLQIEDVEYRFGELFVDPLSSEELDKWQPFVQFVTHLLRYDDGSDRGTVNAGGIPSTQLPMLVHWKARRGTAAQENEQEAGRRDSFNQVTTINTSNPSMRNLLKLVQDRNLLRIDIGSLVGNILHSSYHLAMLEQDAGLRPDTFNDVANATIGLIERAMTGDIELGDLKASRDQLQAELVARNEELDAVTRAHEPAQQPRIVIPIRPERRMAAVVVVDLVGSTEALADMDSDQSAQVFQTYVEVLKAEIESDDPSESRGKGFFDKFTGDGVIALFGVESPEIDAETACTGAIRFCGRARVLTDEFGDRADVRGSLDEIVPGRSGTGAFRCRVAIAYGPVGFGDFGGAGSAVGKRMVEAARICSDKELYDDHAGGLLITKDVFHAIGSPKNYELLRSDYKLRGLPRKVDLYRQI